MNFHSIFRKKKDKAFVLFSVIIISFLLISIILLIQIFVNSKIQIYKSNVEKSQIIGEKDFLEEIIEKEFSLIEAEIKKGKISYAYEYFSTNNIEGSGDKKEIFKFDMYSKRLSYGGYRLLGDKEDFNYRKYLQNKIDNSYGNSIIVVFYKNIEVGNRKIKIKVKIIYNCGISKSVDDLYEPKLKRILIKEYEK